MSVDRQSIFSVADWFASCPPKRGTSQWKDKFSAKESAKAWFRKGAPAVPDELRDLWRSRPEFEDYRVVTAHPEVATPLDDFQGARHHDLVLLGVAGGVRTLISVEAKAGEDFGPVIGPYLKEVTQSNVLERINALAGDVFGRPVVSYDPQLVRLRYQLLHALAGTVIEARERGASQAAMVVHYFPNDRKPIVDSLRDFQQFVAAASRGAVAEIQPGELVRLQLPGGGRVPAGSEVWVGWATAPETAKSAKAASRQSTHATV